MEPPLPHGQTQASLNLQQQIVELLAQMSQLPVDPHLNLVEPLLKLHKLLPVPALTLQLIKTAQQPSNLPARVSEHFGKNISLSK